MNVAYKTLFAGMLAIVFCAPAVAHDSRHSDWSGGVSVFVAPDGRMSWSSGLNYGPVVTHGPQHIAVHAPYRGPVCSHPSHRHAAVHHRGYKHWKKHRHSHFYH